jgi:hypothetical protein
MDRCSGVVLSLDRLRDAVDKDESFLKVCLLVEEEAATATAAAAGWSLARTEGAFPGEITDTSNGVTRLAPELAFRSS